MNLFKEYIARAFPGGDDLILDSEILMVDNVTGQPLPFGTLGIHKVKERRAGRTPMMMTEYLIELVCRKPSSRTPTSACSCSIACTTTARY